MTDSTGDWFRDAVIYELHVRGSPTRTATAPATSTG